MQSRWTQVGRLLQAFQEFLAPDKIRLNIENGVDCLVTKRLAQKCPALKKPGVYLVFDDHEALIYIGSTASRPLIDRLRDQITSTKLGMRPRWIDIIPFDWEWSFFIPALELYLIQKVHYYQLADKNEGTLINKVGMFAGHRERLNELLDRDEG